MRLPNIQILKPLPSSAVRSRSGFTMMEIALCLAIIGFALVSMLLVLPGGMDTQRKVNEETIVGQDATMLLDAIRSGARGADDLTNYVYAITNYWSHFIITGGNVRVDKGGTNGYSYTKVSITSPTPQPIYPRGPYSDWPIDNGADIVGLMSMPELIADSIVLPNTNFPAVPDIYYAYSHNISGFYSNHVVAYVRSMSGLAAEKPPQDNAIMQGDAFSYRVVCVNSPIAMDTNIYTAQTPAQRNYVEQLANSLRELRLYFMWPQLPNGNVGPSRLTFRTSIAGQLALTNVALNPSILSIPGVPSIRYPVYLYQAASFTTNTP